MKFIIIEQETSWFHLSLPPSPIMQPAPRGRVLLPTALPADSVPGADLGFLDVVKYRLRLVVTQVIEHEVINPNE